jgi:hypothetical protein
MHVGKKGSRNVLHPLTSLIVTLPGGQDLPMAVE